MVRILGAVAAGVLALTLAPAALGHAHIAPEHVEPDERLEFTLRLREEVDGAHTTRVEMTVPDGFSLHAAVSDPEWLAEVAGRVVTWTGRGDLDLRFTGTAEDAGNYAFKVRQHYSNEAVMNWAGAHATEMPAAVVDAKEGGRSMPVIIVFAIAAIVTLAGAVIFLVRGRPLA